MIFQYMTLMSNKAYQNLSFDIFSNTFKTNTILYWKTLAFSREVFSCTQKNNSQRDYENKITTQSHFFIFLFHEVVTCLTMHGQIQEPNDHSILLIHSPTFASKKKKMREKVLVSKMTLTAETGVQIGNFRLEP